MDWGALAAISGALAVVGGVFLWVVRMIVQASIYQAVNGFSTRLALIEQTLKSQELHINAVDSYAHTKMHETLNNFINLQLEAWKQGSSTRG